MEIPDISRRPWVCEEVAATTRRLQMVVRATLESERSTAEKTIALAEAFSDAHDNLEEGGCSAVFNRMGGLVVATCARTGCSLYLDGF